MSDQLAFARATIIEAQGDSAVGDFIETVAELDAPGTHTHYFACKLKGYPDWRWAVTLFTDESGASSVSEINLLPADTSILAPAWVPWSERLADYKALQAELEAQAAAEAAEAGEADLEAGEEEEEAAEDEADDISEAAMEEALEQQSALADVPVAQESEDEAADASGNPASFFRRKFLRRNKKRK